MNDLRYIFFSKSAHLNPLYQCPAEKKISSGDTRQIPAGTGKGTELSGDFSGKQQKFSGNSSRSDGEPGIDLNSAGHFPGHDKVSGALPRS